MRQIFRFKDDLRISDNIGLISALEDSTEVIPVYIIPKNFINSPNNSSARVNFLFDSLKDLDNKLKQLNSKLIIRYGNPEHELIKLALETKSKGIYFNKSYTPDAIKEDKSIINHFVTSGFRVKTFKDQVIFEENDLPVKTRKGNQSFNIYKKKWLDKYKLNTPKTLKPNDKLLKKFITTDWIIDSIKQLRVEDYGFTSNTNTLIGGESEALKHLKDLKNSKKSKSRIINFLDDWSKLSPYIRFGNISHRKILEVLFNNEIILNNIIKTEYSISLYLEKVNNISNSENIQSDWSSMYNSFFLWCNGNTGYPIIDASMKQLLMHSVVHQELKRLSINFFINNLNIELKWAKRYFYQKLIDGDSPLHEYEWEELENEKIKNFNPIKEGKKFDKDGYFIKEFVNELFYVPEPFIHEPYKMPLSLQMKTGCVIGQTYPYTCVKDLGIETEIINLFIEKDS